MTKILHTDAFTQRDGLYTGMLLYTGAFTQRCFSQRHAFTQQTFAHKDAFIRRCFYAQLPLRTGAVTQGWFYTKELLHTDTRVLIHTDAFT